MATTTVAKTNSSNMATEQRVQPNQSLYIQNLPEKLQKPDLKRSLYMLFSTFGPVLDVTAVKSDHRENDAGQWVYGRVASRRVTPRWCPSGDSH